MTTHQPLNTATLIRGIFFMVLGTALLLNTIAPSSYLQHLLTIAIVVGSLMMIAYGSILLRLHILLGRLIASWSHDDDHKA